MVIITNKPGEIDPRFIAQGGRVDTAFEFPKPDALDCRATLAMTSENKQHLCSHSRLNSYKDLPPHHQDSFLANLGILF